MTPIKPLKIAGEPTCPHCGCQVQPGKSLLGPVCGHCGAPLPGHPLHKHPGKVETTKIKSRRER